MKDGMLRQIILITDGKSNRGVSPIESSRYASDKGITVSTIGIMDRQSETESEFEEIRGIAKAGEGIYELSYIEYLSQTLHMLTQKTVNKTIGQVVNKQLKELIGEDITSVDPAKRSQFVDYIETFSDEVDLKLCILLDCSGSMKAKLREAINSLNDLMKSLSVRSGNTQIAVIGFPGRHGDDTFVLSDFNDNSDIMNKLDDIKVRGITPTGPAIEYAVSYLVGQIDENPEQGLFEENIV